jgi:hypothetical protein
MNCILHTDQGEDRNQPWSRAAPPTLWNKFERVIIHSFEEGSGMIIKPYEPSDALARLMELAETEPSQSSRLDVEIKKRKAGERAEREVAYLIDFEISKSSNWAVLHDLRIEHDGFSAQIDHVIIDRTLTIYLLETKYFASGLKITDDGEFLRWDNWKKNFVGMESPISQGDRHSKVLSRLFSDSDLLPRRLGMKMRPRIQSFVVVSKDARVDRPKSFDTSMVVKSDQLFDKIQKSMPSISVALTDLTRLVSVETLTSFATELARCDRPIVIDHAAKFGIRTTPEEIAVVPALDLQTVEAVVPQDVASQQQDLDNSKSPGYCCKSCSSTNLQIKSGRFGYYWKCASCDGNTKIILPSEGRLRKEGDCFHFQPIEGPEVLFHRNNPVVSSADKPISGTMGQDSSEQSASA